MINTEFLNSLYKAKFNAEQQIEEQEKLRELPVSHDEADKKPVDEQKKKDMQYGKQILVAHNLEGNMDEPFIGMKGTVTRVKKND